MRFKLLGLMAALVLVAGCETPAEPETTTDTGATQMTSDAISAQEDLVINVGDRVFFDFDKSDLRPDAIDTLNRQSDWMNANGSITVAIEGHCDERGTREYNLALGERRASSAKQYLESMGWRRSATARNAPRCSARTRRPGRRTAVPSWS
jgi:peptidoglycan-associated lipoprotein